MPLDGQEKPPGWGRVPRWTLGKLAFSRSAAAVYLVLATHASRNWLAWPSVETIMSLSGLERRAVQEALRALVERGLIAVEETGGGRRADGTGITTVYRLFTDGKGAPTDAVKGAPGSAVKGTVAEGATAQKPTKKGAPRRAGTDNVTEEATAGAASAAAAAGNHKFKSEIIDALRCAGIGNPARDKLARTAGVTPELVRTEADRLNGTEKGIPILIENIETLAAKSITDCERRALGQAETDAKTQATREKLDRLTAANAAAKELIETLPDDRVAELRLQVLDGCQPLKRAVWERANPRTHADLMREIARVARKSKASVPA